MSVICPVTNKECPYLKKLDSDICPREHTCDEVIKSYSGMIQKPPAPRKFLIITFSILLALIVGVCLVYFLVLDGDLSSLGIGKNSSEKPPATENPAIIVQTQVPSEQPVQTATPSNLPSQTPLPVTTPAPQVLPDVPVTTEDPTMPVRVGFNDLIAEVKGVPLDENQNIKVLLNALVISWYEGSYIPGATGNCLLFGYKHFDGMAGIFYYLDELKMGDTVEFTLDNGSKIIQKVTEITVYEDGYLPDTVFELENETPRTVIISETGDIDTNTGGYKDLIVVITE